MYSFSKLIKDKRNIHLLYSYFSRADYLTQLLSYIKEGIEAEEYIILVENEKNYALINQELEHLFSVKQREYLHFVNSLDFYFSSGSYHPPAITEYFNKVFQPYITKQLTVRSWAHVE